MSNEVKAALIGALVGGLIALIGTVLAALFESRRARADGNRRDMEWRREKCNEAYSQAIYYLFKLQMSSVREDAADKEVRQHLSEAQRYLSLLQAYHPSAVERATLSQVTTELTTSVNESRTISEKAEAARIAVEVSLHATWSPTVREQAEP